MQIKRAFFFQEKNSDICIRFQEHRLKLPYNLFEIINETKSIAPLG